MCLVKGKDGFWNKRDGKLDKFITGDPVRKKIRIIKNKMGGGVLQEYKTTQKLQGGMHLGQWWDMTAITAKLHPWICVKGWIGVQGHSGLGIGCQTQKPRL